SCATIQTQGGHRRRECRAGPAQLGACPDWKRFPLVGTAWSSWGVVRITNWSAREPAVASYMTDISYRGHRFPPIVIQHAVWLYLRFTLSYRDVEELLAERGLDVSYEAVRSWVLKFGPIIARRLRRSRPRPSNRWHLDEMVVRIAGKHMYR